METYDFIFAGGGLAGLSLAYQLCQSLPADPSILILDSEKAGSGDRTWSFWSTGDTPFADLATGIWSKVRFASTGYESVINLNPYAYYTIRGEDFYNKVLSDLEERASVRFLTATVLETGDASDSTAFVRTSKGEFVAEWVFDSRFDPAEYVNSQPSGFHSLMQHFQGWVIETETERFDPATPTLFDFNVPQHGEMRFMYVLPFSATRALVEFTLFSARLLDDDEYTRNIERYIARHLGIADFRVVEKERGVIPMSDRPFPRRGGRRVINIGTRAGRVKASTGYAFKRVQDDTAAIVMSMEVSGRPDTFPPDRTGFRTLDTLLLQIMYRRGDLSEQVFTALFKRNSAERLLRFLDEETTVWETIKVMATVPWVPFIGAWFRTKVLKRI